MGKLTEYIYYINADKHPTAQDIKHLFGFFTIDENAKQARKKYRKELKLKVDENE